jgi:hypothetical protein
MKQLVTRRFHKEEVFTINFEMGLANDAARLRTASVRQDQRKYNVQISS